MSTYYKLGSLIEGISSTATTGGTTTLTVSSRSIQQFTGTSTQTVVLPNATTLKVGRRFDINNRSTEIITVQDGSLATVATIPAGSQRFFLVTDISTAAGVWRTGGVTGSGGTSVTNADTLALLSGIAGMNFSNDTIESRKILFNFEEMGGNYWIIRSSLPSNKGYHSGFVVGGFSFTQGGYDGATSFTTTERHSDDSNYWLTRSNSAVGRFDQVAFTLNEFGYVSGGRTPTTNTTEKYNPTLNSWESKDALDVATYKLFGFALGGYGYAAGGNTGSAVDTVQAYDSVANSWFLRAKLPAARQASGAAKLNGYGYVFGGATPDNNTYKFDEATNSWLSNLANMVTGLQSPSAGEVNGVIISAGGNTGSISGAVQEYSDISKSWASKTPLSTPKAGASHAMLGIGVGLIAGGDTGAYIAAAEQYVNTSMFSLGSLKKSRAVPTSIFAAVNALAISNKLPVQIRTDGDSWKNFTTGENSALKLSESLQVKLQPQGTPHVHGGATDRTSTESYDALSNVWTNKAASAIGKEEHGGFNVDGLSYIYGGANGGPYLDTGYRYDSITNTWSAVLAVMSGIASVRGFSLNGFGYVVHGYNGTVVSGVVQKYNATANSFSSASSLPTPKNVGSGLNLIGRAYLALGSTTSSSLNATTSIHEYNDVLDSWTARTSASIARQSAGSCEIEESAHLFGGDNASTLNSAEKYNTHTDTWIALANMGSTRARAPSAIRDNLGNIMIAGGYSGADLNTTEAYNPYSNTYIAKANMNVARSLQANEFAPGSYRNYEIRVGIPALYAGLGAGVWVTKLSNAVVAKSSGASFTFGSEIYCSDGSGGAELQKYNPITDSWVLESDYPFANQEQTSINTACNGFGHRFGDGVAAVSTACYKYEPISKAWISSAAHPFIMYQHSVACLNSLTYMWGGNQVGTGLVTSNRYYSDVSNSWTSRTNALNTSQHHLGSSLNGFIYSTGSNLHNQYNDAADSWVSKTIPGYTGTGINGFLVQGKLVTAGGGGVATTQNYDDNLNSWIAKQDMPAGRDDAFNGHHDDTGYILCGYNGSATSTAFSYAPSVKQAILGFAMEVK